MIDSKSKFEQELLGFLGQEFPEMLPEDRKFFQTQVLDLFCAFLAVTNSGGFVRVSV
jgi:hypothetical protein